VSPKGAKPDPRGAKPAAAQEPDAATVSILPMEIQVGDRFNDAEGEWEVVSHPAKLHGAKSLRARVRPTEQPAAEREVTWPAHVRVEIWRTRVSLLTELGAFFTEHRQCGCGAGLDEPSAGWRATRGQNSAAVLSEYPAAPEPGAWSRRRQGTIGG
jgi:hypothetical protein